MKHPAIIAAALTAIALHSCFTGIESTPRITAGEVRRQSAAKPTPEMLFLADILPEPPAEWHTGKRFYVSDNRIAKLFSYTDGRSDSLAGTDLIYAGRSGAPSLTGEGATEIDLVTWRGDTLQYRIDASPENIAARPRLEIPFTIERAPVERADSMMRGHIYYISTPLWRTVDGRNRPGLRHVPVSIERVEPGIDGIYPAAVIFSHEGDTAMVMMSLGGVAGTPRSFASLFSFTNPRDAFPHISDEVWQLIVHSRVQHAMTRDECRLALGTPTRTEQIPTTAGMVERWSYGDGIYLIFEDGALTSYRL